MAEQPSKISKLEIAIAKDRAAETGEAQVLVSRDGDEFMVVTSEGTNQVVDTRKSRSES